MPTETQIMLAAAHLLSEVGENPEYDRAIVELVSDTCGFSSDHKSETERILRQMLEMGDTPFVEPPLETIKVENNGVYQWVTLTHVDGPVTVVESERVDKHREPHLGLSGKPRNITDYTIAMATVDAIAEARRRVNLIVAATRGSLPPNPQGV